MQTVLKCGVEVMFTRKPQTDAEMRLSPVPPQRVAPPILSAPTQPAPKELVPAQSQAEDGLVIIGKGTRVNGKIGDCRILDVYGILEADVVADLLIVREGGGIKGMVQSASARVHGVFEGTLMVHDHLEIQSTGQVTGDVSYRTLAIQAGARLRGNIVCSQPEPPETAAIEPTSNVIPIMGMTGDGSMPSDTVS